MRSKTEQELLQSIKLYLLDMDGTLYLGDKLFHFTLELLNTFRATGRKYLFMTNNSSKSVEDYVEKLKKLGISASREDFITSSQATAYYLKRNHPNRRLYVCGTQSLIKELQREGFAVTQKLDEVECVVMGFDTELTFQKLEDVCRLLMANPQIPYIATNPDYVCPTEFGSVPDCGSVCDMIYNATGKRPVVIGKPSPLMPELAMKKYGYSKEETAVVGDRIYTDIKSGLNAGITGILVMSGETTEEILKESGDKPHIVLKDGSEIIDAIKE
ncbi:MAG: HAD-IIA family hydrolase [Ruminococcaceae bacterium]|nr:HAD-IIA family hydrolase [Oscillospiraceae bacterium]